MCTCLCGNRASQPCDFWGRVLVFIVRSLRGRWLRSTPLKTEGPSSPVLPQPAPRSLPHLPARRHPPLSILSLPLVRASPPQVAAGSRGGLPAAGAAALHCPTSPRPARPRSAHPRSAHPRPSGIPLSDSNATGRRTQKRQRFSGRPSHRSPCMPEGHGSSSHLGPMMGCCSCGDRGCGARGAERHQLVVSLGLCRRRRASVLRGCQNSYLEVFNYNV